MPQRSRNRGKNFQSSDRQPRFSRDSRGPKARPARAASPSAALQEFQARVAITPNRKIPLAGPDAPLTLRVLDLICPIGFGQRALILAPPRTGKTTFLRDLCLGVTAGAPTALLYALLVDERPEEVTDFRRSVQAEVFASSNDRSLEEHLATAATCLEKAITEALTGKDVVIVVDSLTRLSRAHNLNTSTGRTMSGGIDANALELPKRFFGAARQLENSGSLTIIATALIDTGSRMDEVIAQEFKGTGNTEVLLDRRLADRRIFPAIDIAKSGTRKEEQLLDPAALKVSHLLRRHCAEQTTVEATKLLLTFFEKTPSNEALIAELSRESL
ncbi:MAG: transcription termination factor Rho [Deltaproteobacteria bacterium]|nr:transcription termination factor Rho [Deltaproteobacteria bacterium]